LHHGAAPGPISRRALVAAPDRRPPATIVPAHRPPTSQVSVEEAQILLEMQKNASRSVLMRPWRAWDGRGREGHQRGPGRGNAPVNVGPGVRVALEQPHVHGGGSPPCSWGRRRSARSTPTLPYCVLSHGATGNFPGSLSHRRSISRLRAGFGSSSNAVRECTIA